MRHNLVLIALPLLLAACDGPAEKAGKAKDRAAAEAAGVPYAGNGPNQRLGEAQDRITEAQQAEVRAHEQSLDRRKDAIKTNADIAADELESKAQSIRDQARREADMIGAPAPVTKSP